MGKYRTASIVLSSVILALGVINLVVTIRQITRIWSVIIALIPIVVGSSGLFGILKKHDTFKAVYKYGLIVLGVASIIGGALFLYYEAFIHIVIEVVFIGLAIAGFFVYSKYHHHEHHHDHDDEKKVPLV